jgi:hypothetical protein
VDLAGSARVGSLPAKVGHAVACSLVLVIAGFAFVGPGAAACPTPPGDCAARVTDFFPDFSRTAPEIAQSFATNISFNAGTALVWANVTASGKTEDSGRIHVVVGTLSNLRVTVFPSNKTTAANASVWINATHPDVYTQAALRVAPLDLVNLTGTAVESGFLLAPGALRGEYGLHVSVTIGNETGSGTAAFLVDKAAEPFSLWPIWTFVGGLFLGVALVAFMGRGKRSKPGRPKA